MEIGTIMRTTGLVKPSNVHSEVGSFKAVLEKKRAERQSAIELLPTQTPSDQTPAISDAVTEMINNHEEATKSIKSFMTRTDYSPEKLLAIQYKTGVLFLKEQMFTKTAELTANTVKNFTQMQI